MEAGEPALARGGVECAHAGAGVVDRVGVGPRDRVRQTKGVRSLANTARVRTRAATVNDDLLKHLGKLRILVARLAESTPVVYDSSGVLPHGETLGYHNAYCTVCDASEHDHNRGRAPKSAQWEAAPHKEWCPWVHALKLTGKERYARQYPLISMSNAPAVPPPKQVRETSVRPAPGSIRPFLRAPKPKMTEDERRAWWMVSTGESYPPEPGKDYLLSTGADPSHVGMGVVPPWLSEGLETDDPPFQPVTRSSSVPPRSQS